MEEVYKSEEVQNFEQFVIQNDHPCLMAQAVVSQSHFVLKKYGELGFETNVQALMSDLGEYIEKYDFEGHDFYTFIAVFGGESHFTEEEYEKRLWQQLQLLHEADPTPWDPKVTDDPNNSNFSFSLLGHAFYIVGLHPNSSRLARQAPRPTLVFNLHHQFEKLRELGGYEHTRDKIRERDEALQGFINPMMADFGHGKEAPQYSGRQVDDSWKCPFHPKNQL